MRFVPQFSWSLVAAALMTTGLAAQTAPLPHRDTLWDLKIGSPISEQPPASAYQNFACGSNGGAPRLKLTGWADYAKCRAESNGLHEVYFEYDDELEYIARALDHDLEISRWAGTTELGYPVITSALFDDKGILQGIRIVTDPRPDYREDIVSPDVSKRNQAFKFGATITGHFAIDPATDCVKGTPGPGESPVGGIFVKLTCHKVDAKKGWDITTYTAFFRKPGQSAYNPQMPTQLTKGQYESSARADILALPKP